MVSCACCWVERFVHNTRSPPLGRKTGPLTTEELSMQRRFWEKRTQQEGKKSENYENDRLQLNLQLNDQQLLECRGRIQGVYPVHLPDTAVYTEKFVEEAHESTLHGGMQLALAKVREGHWVPGLRRLVKRIVKKCAGCKRFQATALAYHLLDHCHEIEPKDPLHFKLWALAMLVQSSIKCLKSVKEKPT